MTNGKVSRIASADALNGKHALELSDLIDSVDMVDARDAIQLALMDRI